MTINLLTDLTRLARVAANTLGQSATPETMQQVWGVISEGEKVLAELKSEADKPLPVTPEVVQPGDASAP